MTLLPIPYGVLKGSNLIILRGFIIIAIPGKNIRFFMEHDEMVVSVARRIAGLAFGVAEISMP